MLPAILAGALLGALATPSSPAARCSLGSPWDGATRWPGAVTFLGTATGETVLAGAGDVKIGRGGGHIHRPIRGRPIHGQVVRVTRLSPTVAPAVAAAIRRAGNRVVLVPWDYDAGCDPTPWGGSWRWLVDSTAGLFRHGPRPREHWARGIPTFDVTPFMVPYTGSSVPDYMLTPAQLLGLMATLPTDDAVQRQGEAAYAPFRRWLAANPALAARAPVPDVLEDMRSVLTRLRGPR